MKKETSMLSTLFLHRWALPVLGMILVGCASAPPGGTPGMVYDEEGRPLPGVEVSVQGEVLARSDINGRFLLDPLAALHGSAKGRVLDFKREGYEPGSVNIDSNPEPLPGSVVYVKLPSRDQLLKQVWAALDRSDFTDAGRLFARAEALGTRDAFWAETKASLLLLDPNAVPGDLQAFLPDMLAGRYGLIEPGWHDWWTAKLGKRTPAADHS